MIRKFVFTLTLIFFSFSSIQIMAQMCLADTSLHKPGYKPQKLPNVKTDSNYNESITILVKRDTFKMIGNVKFNVQIDSVKATSVLGLPSGYSYECQHPRCVFLWDTVKCVRIFGKTNQSGVYPLRIPVIGYAKISSTSLIQKDTIRDFTLIVDGDPAGSAHLAFSSSWGIYPVPASKSITVYNTQNCLSTKFQVMNINGINQNIPFQKIGDVYTANLEILKQGVYMISNGLETKKLIIQ